MTTFGKGVSRSQRSSAAGKAFTLWAPFGVILVSLIVSCSVRAPLEDIDLKEKMFNAYGGRERLAQVHSIAAEGKITALVRGDSGVYRRALRWDGKLFVDIQYTQSRETRILNGTRALRGIDGKIEEVSGAGQLAMIYQYNELSMPFALLDNSFDVSDEGRYPLGGLVVRVLRCTDRAGNSIDLFIDEVTFRIVKTLGSFSVEGKPTTLSAVFGDFRFFEGVLMPFKIVNYAGDTKISETIIDDYRFNMRLSDAMFDLHAHTPGPSKE